MFRSRTSQKDPYRYIKIYHFILSLVDTSSDEAHFRQKRAAALAIFEMATTVLDLANTGYGYYQDHEDARDMQRLQATLRDIQRATEEIKVLLRDVMARQAWQHAVDVLGDDIQSLSFILFMLNDGLWNPNGSVISDELVSEWADNVLNRYDIAKITFNFHEMMMGKNFLFGSTPLFTLFAKILDRDVENFELKIQQFVNFTVEIQTAGYVCWILALDIQGRPSVEAAKVYFLATQRVLTEQRELLEYLEVNMPEPEAQIQSCNGGMSFIRQIDIKLVFGIVMLAKFAVFN